jgi:hypothetical protein
MVMKVTRDMTVPTAPTRETRYATSDRELLNGVLGRSSNLLARPKNPLDKRGSRVALKLEASGVLEALQSAYARSRQHQVQKIRYRQKSTKKSGFALVITVIFAYTNIGIAIAVDKRKKMDCAFIVFRQTLVKDKYEVRNNSDNNTVVNEVWIMNTDGSIPNLSLVTFRLSTSSVIPGYNPGMPNKT